MVIGEGEEADREVLELLRTAKREGWSKSAFLRRAAQQVEMPNWHVFQRWSVGPPDSR